MYCAEWDLLFILGGRKLQLFEIVRHDCRRLAEKMRHTRMNTVPHSIVWVFFFFLTKPTLFAPHSSTLPFALSSCLKLYSWSSCRWARVLLPGLLSLLSQSGLTPPRPPRYLLLSSLMRLQFLQQITVQPPLSSQICSGWRGYHGERDPVHATPDEEVSKIRGGGCHCRGKLRGSWQLRTEHSWDSEECTQGRTH